MALGHHWSLGADKRRGARYLTGAADWARGMYANADAIQHYQRALEERSVRLVTVSGEPGVGKSRLVREFRAFVDAQPELVNWRQGHCLPYGEGISFWALGEVLKAQAGVLQFAKSGEPAAAK